MGRVVFLDAPLYVDLPDGRRRKLVRDVPVSFDCPDHPLLVVTLTIRAGFVTDGASVPRGLWNVLPPFGRYSQAALLHDWLYYSGEYTRAAADRLFLDAMRSCGVPLWKRWVMYSGVRMGGWVAWNRYRSGQGHDRGA